MLRNLHAMLQYWFSLVIDGSGRERLLFYARPDISFLKCCYYTKEVTLPLPSGCGQKKTT
jgi:hypothetical protein